MTINKKKDRTKLRLKQFLYYILRYIYMIKFEIRINRGWKNYFYCFNRVIWKEIIDRVILFVYKSVICDFLTKKVAKVFGW